MLCVISVYQVNFGGSETTASCLSLPPCTHTTSVPYVYLSVFKTQNLFVCSVSIKHKLLHILLHV